MTCVLHSPTKKGWKSIQASNPKSKFTYFLSKKDFLPSLKKFIKKEQKKGHYIIGYFSYDLGYRLHDIKKTKRNDIKLPDIYLLSFDKLEKFQKKKPNKKTYKGDFKPTITEKQYRSAYNKIKNYIREGDIYQINYTHRLEAKTDIPPLELFSRIITKNPSDYCAYIDAGNFQILSASPEKFIQIKNQKAETRPIKGTRPIGKNMDRELLNSEKEAAELNMITDLLRNDLGKVSKIGSVRVRGKRLLQKCQSVWHTYSRITSEIDPKISNIDALISMLPGGSITGCPKKRAMEIIDELETHTRGIYTGIIGIIHPNGDLHFNIAIRTVIKKGAKLYLQVGGGIVIDSTEQAEYKETLDKAKAFLKVFK